MNFIFDIGNVLIHFQPEAFLHGLLNNPSLENRMNRLIFKSNEWIQLDRGTITPEEAYENFCLREPHDQEVIASVMERIPEMMTPIPETVDLLPKVKAAGHRLYYLSNYHMDHSRCIQSRNAFFNLFDGGVFSCNVHLLKPEPEIYRCLLDRYCLSPGDCVFFDDVRENVSSAERLGIKGVLFTGAHNVIEFI